MLGLIVHKQLLNEIEKNINKRSENEFNWIIFHFDNHTINTENSMNCVCVCYRAVGFLCVLVCA